MHINVLIYIRVSTADQESGRDTQKDVITNKLKSLGYRHIVQTFIDEEVSGDSHIEEREVDMLGYASVTLRALGVEIRATDESEESLVTRIYDVLGEEELKKYRQKRVYGIKRRINEEKIMSRAPFGYKIEQGKLVVDETLRLKIIQIFQMFEDNVTMSTISNKFEIPRSTLAYMRKNPIYTTGEYTWKGKVIYKVEPVIKEGDIKPNEEDFYG